METLEAIAKRYSCRKFKPEPVSEENLQKILRAGMSAPVGMGAYGSLHITVIGDKAFLNEIGDAVSAMAGKAFGKKMDKNFGEAFLVIVSSKSVTMPGLEMANTACVLENMLIDATSLGIDSLVHAGAAVVLAQDPEMLARLNLPDGFKPVLAASFGYATEKEEGKGHTISVNRI